MKRTVGLLLFFGLCVGFYFWSRDDQPLDYTPLAFEPGPEDPAINGFTHARQVAERFPDAGLGPFYDEFGDDADDWSDEQAEKALAANKAFMAAMEEAFERDVFRFDQEPHLDTFLTGVSALRGYFTLRALEARRSARSDGAGTGLRRLSDAAQEIAIFEASRGGLVSILTGFASANLMDGATQRLLADPSLTSPELRAAIADYPLINAHRQGMHDTAPAEFAFARSAIDTLRENPGAFGEMAGGSTEGPPPDGLKTKVSRIGLGALFDYHETINNFYRFYLEMQEQSLLHAVDQDYPVTEELLAQPDRNRLMSYARGNPVGKILQVILIPAVQEIGVQVHRAEARSRATYLLMALKAYELEHGALPETLDALTPDIIESIPADPFDGKPMRYDSERRIVYSVGEDLEDQGGSELPSRLEAPDDYEDELAEHDKLEPTFHLP